MKENKFYTVKELQEFVEQVADGKLEMPQFKSMEEAERFAALLKGEIAKVAPLEHKRPLFSSFEQCREVCYVYTPYDEDDREDLNESALMRFGRKLKPHEFGRMEGAREKLAWEEATYLAEKKFAKQVEVFEDIKFLQQKLYKLTNTKKQAENDNELER